MTVERQRAKSAHIATQRWINERRAELGHSPLTRLETEGDPIVNNLPTSLEPVVRRGPAPTLTVTVAGNRLTCPVPAAVMAFADPTVIAVVTGLDDEALAAPECGMHGRVGLGVGKRQTVAAVDAGSPADMAGLLVGDRIRFIKGVAVEHLDSLALRNRIGGCIEKRFSIGIERDGVQRTLSIERSDAL